MLPKKLSIRIYLIITLIISLLFIYFTWNEIKSTREIVRKDIEYDLVKIVIYLQQQLTGSYDELLSKERGSLSNTEKIEILNRSLQPIVNRISMEWPGYGMGFYSIDQKIVALVPFNKDFLGKSASSEALKVYPQKKLIITQIQDGFTWGKGTTIIGANYPIFDHGVLIGHVWANIKTESIKNSVNQAVSQKLLEYFFIWVLLILAVFWVIRKTNKTLTELISQISNDTIDRSKFIEVPELLPVLDVIQVFKNKQRIASEEREKVREEIFRLDRLNIVGEMAAGIGHEIRNPMTTVRGFLQLLEDKPQYHEDLEFFKLMISELDRANGIITAFLSLARNNPVELKNINLNDIIKNIVPLIYSDAIKTDKQIMLDQMDIPNTKLDEKEVIQLVLNLVRNGLEAMFPGGILFLKTYFNGKEVVLEVEDSGCGIPQEIIDKIGQPFVTSKETGTGLGLSVCYSICKRHHAKLDYKTSSEGTIFYVKFPV